MPHKFARGGYVLGVYLGLVMVSNLAVDLPSLSMIKDCQNSLLKSNDNVFSMLTK